MRTRLLFCLLLVSSAAACSAPTPTAPVTRPPSGPVMDTDSTGAATGQHGSGTGG